MSLTITTLKRAHYIKQQGTSRHGQLPPLHTIYKGKVSGQREDRGSSDQTTKQTWVISLSLVSCKHNQYNNIGVGLWYSQEKAWTCIKFLCPFLCGFALGKPPTFIHKIDITPLTVPNFHIENCRQTTCHYQVLRSMNVLDFFIFLIIDSVSCNDVLVANKHDSRK